MIDAPWMASPDDPYVVGGMELCIVEEPSKRVRAPTPTERLVLDELLQDPGFYDNAGRLYHFHGVEVPGIEGLVLTYERPVT